ncbi:MAG: SRPBCC family protein [Bacteroidota bacterium]
MKKIIKNTVLGLTGLFVLLLVAGSIVGSSANIHVETHIDAPADKAWDILGRQFVGIDTWSSTVESSRVATQADYSVDIVPARNAPVPGRVTVSKLVEATEILLDYSDEQRDFTFVATGLPSFMVTSMKNHSQIVAHGIDKSAVVFDIELVFTRPFFFMKYVMANRMQKTFGLLQGELKTYAETGKIAGTLAH